ncbi:MAG: CoA pyrophosphatase [Bacteroidales bacterium]|nr:MAG: CoA pyrophosphatase [Bacteroidales bacterium]
MPLPGEASQNKMIPVTRSPLNIDITFQSSSVLILLYPYNNEMNVILMKRTLDDTPHSGQISFPGGRFEPGDNSLQETALREAEEELGISASGIEILGHLTPLQIQVSNMEVKPFVGVLYKKPLFRPNPGEVDYLIEVKVKDLLDPGIIEKKVEYIRGNRIEMPYYNIRNNHIWGATAMILSEFLDILRNIGIWE